MILPKQKRALLSWSGGKDAAMALHQLQKNPAFEVAGLVTTVTETTRRMPIHGVSEALLKRQAQSLNLPLAILRLPQNCPNAEYEARLAQLLFESRRDLAVTAVAFGDLFLKNIRAYREKFLKTQQLEPLFPLWGEDTATRAQEILAAGFKSKIVSVWSGKVEERWLGQDFGEAFLNAQPKKNDPCGENGEFHTFTYQGPNFKDEVEVALGAIHTEGPYRWIQLTD